MSLKGLKFLLSFFSPLLLFPTAIYTSLTLSGLNIPVLHRITLSVSSFWIERLARWAYISWRDTRAIKRLGAQLVPQIPFKYPFGIDILWAMIEEEKAGYLTSQLASFVEEYGRTFRISAMGDNQVMTLEPEYIKRVLATDFHNYEKGERFTGAARSVLGVGVFNSDHDMWKFHRAMTRPFFSRERISDFDTFGAHADIAVNALSKRLAEGEAVDFQDLVSRFTLDSATEFLFGSCVHALSTPLPYSENSPKSSLSSSTSSRPSEIFSKAFMQAQFVIAKRTRLGRLWPFWEIWKDATHDDMKIILEYIDPIIKEALAKKDKEGGRKEAEDGAGEMEVKEGATLLDHLVNCTDDKIVIRDETLNILIAGRDTTASTLTFATYMLAMHPEIRSKLRVEILQTVGPTRYPTYDDIRSMKYLRAFINEVLRLFSPVPFDIRCTIGATLWPSTKPGEKPYYLPAGTNVTYSPFAMHRNKDLWGPTALDFDPERFIDDRLGKYLTPNPFIFLPFNAGPRICLGQQFAYNESSFFLIRLLQTFEGVELARDAQPLDSLPPTGWKDMGGRAPIEQVVMKSHLTLVAKGGLWVKMTKAKEGEAV